MTRPQTQVKWFGIKDNSQQLLSTTRKWFRIVGKASWVTMSWSWLNECHCAELSSKQHAATKQRYKDYLAWLALFCVLHYSICVSWSPHPFIILINIKHILHKPYGVCFYIVFNLSTVSTGNLKMLSEARGTIVIPFRFLTVIKFKWKQQVGLPQDCCSCYAHRSPGYSIKGNHLFILLLNQYCIFLDTFLCYVKQITVHSFFTAVLSSDIADNSRHNQNQKCVYCQVSEQDSWGIWLCDLLHTQPVTCTAIYTFTHTAI